MIFNRAIKGNQIKYSGLICWELTFQSVKPIYWSRLHNTFGKIFKVPELLESRISYSRSGKDRCGIYKTRCVEYILKDCIRNVWVDLVVVRDPMGRQRSSRQWGG